MTTPTLGIVIPDSATLVHTMQDRANLDSRCAFHTFCVSRGADHFSKDSAVKRPCAYQFSCRAADWSRSDMHAVPMQFEPLELHVIDALGQQEVPDYFQQPAKAITEDVSVMKGPYAQEWIAAVLEEIESFKKRGSSL